MSVDAVDVNDEPPRLVPDRVSAERYFGVFTGMIVVYWAEEGRAWIRADEDLAVALEECL